MTKLPGYQPLQNLILSPGDSSPRELFYSGHEVIPSSKGLALDRGGYLDFGTYFNIFSWDKWYQYTGLESLSLVLETKGGCVVKMQSLDFNGNVLKESVTSVLSGGSLILDVPEYLFQGHIALIIEANGPFYLQSGYWGTSSAQYATRVKVAAVFCTFHRDDYLFSNLDVIEQLGMEELDVLVVDNASRLHEEDFHARGDRCFLYHNPNTGGSGGFTRGLMEAAGSDRGYTHVLFMDDDIKLEEETLYRTVSLLSKLKPEYQYHFLSGAMLPMDEPHRLFESTANWNGFRVKNLKKGLNLANKSDVCRADEEDFYENRYAAWWYCAIPLTKDILEDLPFPFFIYGDDMDYSYRRAPGLITMNGIGVWHEPFPRKFSPLHKSYFFCRNTLILNCLHHKRFNYFHTALNGAAHFFAQIFVHDYRSAELALDALEDFLEGAEYVTALDEQEILRKKTVPLDFKPRSDKELKRAYPIPADFRRWFSPWYFLHTKLAVYNYEKTLVEIRKRSWKKIFSLTIRYTKLKIYLLLRYAVISRTYRELERGQIFWKNRLLMLEDS